MIMAKKSSEGWGQKQMPKFEMFDRTLILFWYLMGSRVSEDV